ncbi:MAG: extracellular solute-binding protein [Candidatus Buchananbacteria bacterium]
MKYTKTKTLVLLLLFFCLITTGFRCNFITPAEEQALQPVELTWWGVSDEPGNFDEMIADYRALHPHVSIAYRQIRWAEFETELLDALAEDRGPDIFTIKNTWLTKYLSKIEPMPATTKIAYQYIKTSLNIKEETVTEIRENPSITAAQLKNAFLDVVYNDVVRDNKIYGLPTWVDTLVMFYNRDLLNNAGIPLPPTTWLAMQQNVKALTYQDKNGNLIQSGTALGTASNIDYAADILSLLMMQNGAEMTNGNQVTFGSIPTNIDIKDYNPGLEALRFYTDFANNEREVYTWNGTFPNSLDSFAQGRVAIIFGYNDDIAYLESKRGGKLNYGIAAMPQIEGRPTTNYANYWINTVSKKSKNINEAWDFLQFIAKSAEAKKYLAKTNRPTALRSLVDEQKKNDQLQVFADQLLTAKSWYQGKNATAMEQSFKTMIDSVNQNTALKEAIELGIQKIQQTY